MFNTDTTEGTYIAFRLLLNAGSLNGGAPEAEKCFVESEAASRMFVPPVVCKSDLPIPDYSPPYWMSTATDASKNSQDCCRYSGPTTWLSVIGMNRFWPMASLGETLTRRKASSSIFPYKVESTPSMTPQAQARLLKTPPEMKVFLVALVFFSLFHTWCCWSGSYTAKPVFRAYFANTGDWRHVFLVLAGSCMVAFAAIAAGWGGGVFSIGGYGMKFSSFSYQCMEFICFMMGLAVVLNVISAWQLSPVNSSDRVLPIRKPWAALIRIGVVLVCFLLAVRLFYDYVVRPIEEVLREENRELTYWRSMHLISGVSPLVPMLLMFAGIYVAFWYTLHGLALFGEDRPCLPSRQNLELKDERGIGKPFLRMFSQEDAAAEIEHVGMPLNWKLIALAVSLFVFLTFAARTMGGKVPIRSLGAQVYSLIVVSWLIGSASILLAETWRFHNLWDDLRKLLTFLDRLPLRRTLAVLHGFSWGTVWKMGGNVLEVRYKVISRQLESMNHAIASLEAVAANSVDPHELSMAQNCLNALHCMQKAGTEFADWYCVSYRDPRAGDLSRFGAFQQSVARAGGALLTQLLIPSWRKENESLLVSSPKDREKESEAKDDAAPQATSAGERTAYSKRGRICVPHLSWIRPECAGPVADDGHHHRRALHCLHRGDVHLPVRSQANTKWNFDRGIFAGGDSNCEGVCRNAPRCNAEPRDEHQTRGAGNGILDQNPGLWFCSADRTDHPHFPRRSGFYLFLDAAGDFLAQVKPQSSSVLGQAANPDPLSEAELVPSWESASSRPPDYPSPCHCPIPKR